eukprot:g11936.t1
MNSATKPFAPLSLLEVNGERARVKRKGGKRKKQIKNNKKRAEDATKKAEATAKKAEEVQKKAETIQKKAEESQKSADRAKLTADNNFEQLKNLQSGLDNAHQKLREHEARSDEISEKIDESQKRADQAKLAADKNFEQLQETVKSIELQEARSDEISKKIDLSGTKAAEVKALSNGQNDKLKRMWAEEDVRKRYTRFRKERGQADRKTSGDDCAKEKTEHIAVFSAIPLKVEVDDKSCINENRDQLIGAFCNFRKDFDTLLVEAAMKDGAHYWPNICCRSWEDKGEKDPCKRGGILREKVVPFAGSQGGEITFENLYGEVKDVLEKDGYLHKGMLQVLQDANIGSDIEIKVNEMFNDISLCGPRMFRDPRHEEEMMCEIFYPYQHLLKTFSDGFSIAVSKKAKQISFLETVARSGKKRYRRFEEPSYTYDDEKTPHVNNKKLEDKVFSWFHTWVHNLDTTEFENTLFSRMKTWLKSYVRSDQSLKGPKGERGEKGDKGDTGDKGDSVEDGSAKATKIFSPEIKQALEKRAVEAKREAKHAKVDGLLTSKASYHDGPSSCPRVTGSDEVTLDNYKQAFCPVRKHVDFGKDVANIAMVYVEHDIHLKHLDSVARVKKELKFVVGDACKSAMFTENDISLQKIGPEHSKHWVALVQLDSTSKDGYLRSQLAHCKSLDYVPMTSMTVKVEKKVLNCRNKGYKEIECSHEYRPLYHHHTKRQLEYAVDVTGSQYTVTTIHKSRRRLLWSQRRNC